MKRCLMFLIMITGFTLFSADFEKADALHHDGKYSEALNNLKEAHDPANPDAALIWRIGRVMFELADGIDKSKKNERIAGFNEAMAFLEPFLTIASGSNFDKASIIFYYASNLGSRSKTIGISESLGTLPDLKKYADQAISLDPSFASAYFLKAKIDEEVPGLFGGDKFRMGELFSLAYKNNPKDLTIVHDAANALINRNWDAKKKIGMADKAGAKKDDFVTKDDMAIAREIITQGMNTYKEMTNPSVRDTNQYESMKKLQLKLK